MRFINLLSLFAASHAAQAVEGRTNPLSAGREANKDGLLEYATIAGDRSDDGASSTHGRMLARRTSKRTLAIRHVHNWMNDFNPVNLEPSALVYAVKWDELLGSEVKIVQWFFKLSVILAAVDIFGVLVCGILYNSLAIAGVDVNASGWSWITHLYSTGAWYLFGNLTIPTLYALWAVPDQRVAYLVMLIVMWAAHGFYFSSYQGYGAFHNGNTGYVSNIIAILVYGLVGWYNWYKVLFPTWTGWGAKHWP